MGVSSKKAEGNGAEGGREGGRRLVCKASWPSTRALL